MEEGYAEFACARFPALKIETWGTPIGTKPSGQKPSALSGKRTQEIATAAEQFGQEDDITVLTVAFSPLAVGAA